MPSKWIYYIYTFIILITFSFNITTSHALSNKIQLKDNGILLKNLSKPQILYSPINGYITYTQGKYILYNKNNNIVLELTGLQKNKKIGKVNKGDIIGVTNTDKWKITTILYSLPQNDLVNLFFYNLLVKNNIKITDNLDFNKETYYTKLQNNFYFDENYKNFFKGLTLNANKGLISEQELLTYKLITEKKFSELVSMYNSNKKILNTIKEKEQYNTMKNFTKCIYSQKYNYCEQLYPKEDKIFHEVIGRIYNTIFIPKDKIYMKNILSENKNNGQNQNKRYTIPVWQLKYYKDKNIDKNYFLTLTSINKQECGRLDGACFNGADAGPFQINQIHRSDFKKSYKYVEKIKNERDPELKQKYTEELFNYQLDWTINRLNNLAKKHCLNQKGDALTKCMAILHNGNTKKTCFKRGKWVDFRYCYADSVVAIKNNYKRAYNLN